MTNFLSSWWRQSSPDLYVCLEISRSYLRATLLSAAANNLTIINNWLAPPGSSLKDFIASLNLPAVKFIILGDSAFAASIPAWVEVKRDHHREIEERELENIISQAVWKFLNHYRPRALASLELEDADILLANIRILNIRVNNHQVINPIGFAARSIEFLLEQTFVNRDAYRELVAALPSGAEIVFLSELGIVESLTVLATSSFNRDFRLLRFLPHEVLLLSSAVSPLRYRDHLSEPIITTPASLNWSRQELISHLSDSLLVPDEVSSLLLELFLTDSLSAKLHRFLKVVLTEEWRKFLKHLHGASSSVRREHLLISDYALPAHFYKSPPLLLKPVSAAGLATFFDFSLLPGQFNSEHIFSPLAGFLSFRLSARGGDLNKLAERRAKWLIP